MDISTEMGIYSVIETEIVTYGFIIDNIHIQSLLLLYWIRLPFML